MSETRAENISILLAIRQEFLRNGVKSIFSSYDDIQVVEELDSFNILADSINAQVPKIAIISTDERNSSVFDYVKTIKALYPEVSIIMMLENFEDELIYAALGSSVSSCLTVGVQADELIACIRKVSHGENPIFDMLTRPGIARLIIKDMESNLNSKNTDAAYTRKTLTDREREILSLIASGHTMEQLVSNINSTENDILQDLTEIYAKVVFNNFCEFSTQPSESAGPNNQTLDKSAAVDAAKTQTLDNHTPEESREREDNKHNSHGKIPSSVWDGFEALKQELQETLDRLSPPEVSHVNIPGEEPQNNLDNVEENIEATANDGEPSSEVITANQDQNSDDIDVTDASSLTLPDAEEVYKESSGIDEGNSSIVENTDDYPSDEMVGSRDQAGADINIDDSLKNSVKIPDKYAIQEDEESHVVPQDKLDTTGELPERENAKLKKQKAKWFKFSFKSDNKTGIQKKTPDEIETTDNKKVPDKPESIPKRVSGLENDSKNSKEKINAESKNTTQKDSNINQERILLSIKKLGMVISIQPPVDVKQLEVFESVLNKTYGVNVVLHKGTSREHFLVISGHDRLYLLNSLRKIPFVDSPHDENEIISLRLLPANEID